ncbi:TPA: hypothetical protein ACJIMT_004921 [Escherichia coli]
MNDLQLHIYQLLQEMDSLEDTPEGVDKAHLAQPAKNDQIEEVTIENVEKSNKPVSHTSDLRSSRSIGDTTHNSDLRSSRSSRATTHKKEKFLTLSSKPITLGKRSTSTPQEIEEKPEIENLLHIVETESIKDKE